MFVTGHDEIVNLLSNKWTKEEHYRLRKELFCFTDNKVKQPFSSMPFLSSSLSALADPCADRRAVLVRVPTLADQAMASLLWPRRLDL
jgi:hypothetical protein